MAIELNCTGCGQRLRVGDENAGKKAKCPQCQAIFTVPMQAAMQRLGESENPLEDGSGAAADELYMQTPDGKSYGPVSRSVMDQWTREGRVTSACQIRHGGEGEWRPASDFYSSLSGPAAPTSTGPAGSGGPSGSSPGSNPYQSPKTAEVDTALRAMSLTPHRGGTILTLAILSWACCIVFGVIAWVMGKNDLAEMRAGRMDRSGEGMTQAGMIVGMVHCILSLVVVVVYAVIIVGMLVADGM